MKQIAMGVHILHENNITHMDIKPSNLFVSKEGTLKVGDFGLSRVRTSSFHYNLEEQKSTNYLSSSDSEFLNSEAVRVSRTYSESFDDTQEDAGCPMY